MLSKILISLLFMLMLSSCSQKSNSVVEAKCDKSDSECHMIESRELRELMHELNMVVYYRLKSELERDNIRRRYALTLAQTIKNLALKIKNIDYKKFTNKLSKEDLSIFKAYSQVLYSSSNKIEIIAKRYEFEKLPHELDSLQNICTSCHSKFGIAYE